MLKNIAEHDVSGPYNIHIQMLKYCPMGCPGCYQEELNSKEQLSHVEILESINSILREKRPETFKITFFGGEPLLKITTILKVLSSLKKHNNMSKNGIIKNHELIEINIPTSGSTGLKTEYGSVLKDNIDDLIKLTNKLNIKLNISISHDGPNNIKHRNIPATKLNNLIYFISDKENEYKRKILPQYLSCVIPQIIDEDYFIDTMLYFMDYLDKPCTFTIPHLLDKNGILFKNPEIFKNAVQKMLNKWYSTELWDRFAPKLFRDIEEKIKHQHNFNWCGAGVNHSAVTTSGISDCEYIKGSGLELLNKMDQYCNTCEIKKYCQRPCLKNMETDPTNHEQFLAQCTLRKILFNELKKAIKLNYKEN